VNVPVRVPVRVPDLRICTLASQISAISIGHPYGRSAMQQFDHEKLDAYGIAVDFVIAANAIAEGATRGKGHADLADQLRRASTSIVLNLAEGAGEYASAEKARFYRMSKRSATECAALVEIYRRLGLVEAEAADKARASLLRIVSMLVRLVVATESGDRRAASGGYA
jgi:four helix bundle protein